MSDPILELLAAPPSPPMSVDEDAVYAGGRRRVRRRALRRTAVGVVGVVAASAIAFATIGDGLGREALPAGPTPSASVGKPVSATLFDGTYAVEVIPGAPADQANVIFYSVKDGKRTKLAGSSAEPTVISMGTGSGADGVMLGTAPADAATFHTVTPGATGGIEMDNQLLPGTDFQAVALRFENPQEVEKYEDTIWMSDQGDGIVRDAMGNRLPAVKLLDRDTFFVAREANIMGLFSPEGGFTKPLSTTSITTMGSGKQLEQDGGWTWRSVTLLPAGARNVSFAWADADYHSPVVTETLPEGQGIVAVATATAPKTRPGPGVTQVTWTDRSGVRHTDPNVN